MKSIIGRKIGMTEVFAADGTMYPVTVVEVLPNVVVAKKTTEKDGYEALVVGYEDKAERKANKAEKGIFAKAGVTPKQGLYELKGDEIFSKNVGESFGAELFTAGEVIDVIGHNKGHGYSGTIKKYHHHIGPKGHGSGYHRQIGSLANNGRDNNRVIPGKKMPGMGGAMDLVVGAKRVIVATTHCDKKGKSKILKKCRLPLTAVGVVSLIVTEFAVFSIKDVPLHMAPIEASLSAPV